MAPTTCPPPPTVIAPTVAPVDLPPFRMTPAFALGLIVILWAVVVVLAIWSDISDSRDLPYPDQEDA